MFVVRRSEHNPIIMPRTEYYWETYSTFNWCPAEKDGKIYALYRAMSHPELLGGHKIGMSTIGCATSTDREHYGDRKQLIVPEQPWEKFGCEDPRVTEIDGTFYIFYTALSTFPFSAEGIKVAVAKTRDFEKIDERHLVTPFNAKAMALFPKKINGKFVVMLSVNTDRPPSSTAFAFFDKEEDMWSETYWNKWYEKLDENVIDLKRSKNDHVEVGAPPIWTDDGWLIVYSYIQNYFSNDKVFGIETVLLDHDDPRKVIGRNSGAIMVPESLYEQKGNVPNVVFPTGALVNGDNLEIYYGSADTTCCMASVNLENLLTNINPEKANKVVRRCSNNPIITPNEKNDWESKYTFNPAAIDLDGKVHILYRAMGKDDTSTIGYASSKDGLSVDERLSTPIYVPREDFEIKKKAGYSGCEDPRLIQVDNRILMFYTAFNGIDAPRVAVTDINVEDFINKKWNWSVPHVITPPGIMDKDTIVLPEKVKDKYMLIHRISDVICMDLLDSLDFSQVKVSKCIQLLKPRHGMWDSSKVGVAAPAIKTDKGWILIYHGVSNTPTYRVGAVLLDKDDPSIVLSRTTVPILEPVEEYEKVGLVNNVVFPCGAIERDGVIYIYYGGADKVVAVATIKTEKLIDILVN